MQRVIPNLWFNDTSEEAANFYITVFKNAKINRIDYYTDAGKEQHGHNAGDVMTVDFQIEDAHFVALNGGPQFSLSPAISFFVYCETAEEVDELWGKLVDGGSVLMPVNEYPFSARYGWLNDKFGVSWQFAVAQKPVSQKIVPALMFTGDYAGQAEEAMNFYASVFPDSSVGAISRYAADQAPDKEGTVTHGEITILGDQFITMDSVKEHDFTFSPAISLLVECQTQEEIDSYWARLSAVPEAEACGWLQDKFGVSWQIVPKALDDMLREGTPEQVERVTTAFMKMKKFDIAALEAAYQN